MNLEDIECKFLRDENFMDIVNQITFKCIPLFDPSKTRGGEVSRKELIPLTHGVAVLKKISKFGEQKRKLRL